MHSEACGVMRRESVLVSVIVLSYMAVLNVFIAQFAYKLLSVPSLSEEDPVRLKVAFGRNASSRSLSRPDVVVFRSAEQIETRQRQCVKAILSWSCDRTPL